MASKEGLRQTHLQEADMSQIGKDREKVDAEDRAPAVGTGQPLPSLSNGDTNVRLRLESLGGASRMPAFRALRRMVMQLCAAAPREALFLVSMLVGSSVASARVWVEFSRVQAMSQTALNKKNVSGFWHGRRLMILVLLKLAATAFAEDISAGWLRLRWREIATKALLERYLPSAVAGQSGWNFPFYRIKLDSSAAPNPDQRIAQDVADAVGDTVYMSQALISNAVSFVSFSSVLLRISPKAFYGLFLYALAGTVVTLRGFSAGLVSAQDAVRSREAHLRFALVRVDECAESVAFYRAAAVERKRLWAAFMAAINDCWRMLFWQTGQQGFQRTYRWVTMILPSVIMAPAYFRGEVELGAISQLFMAFNSVKDVLLFVATNYGALSSLQAKFQRLEHLHCSLARAARRDEPPVNKPGIVQFHPQHEKLNSEAGEIPTLGRICLEECAMDGDSLLELHGLRVAVPGTGNSQPDVRWLGTVGGDTVGSNLKIKPGEAVLLQGPSGVGKSALLRAVAGLWDEGSGHIKRTTKVFFLPQASYLPAGIATASSALREQLLFPVDAAVSDPAVRDEDLVDVLWATRLGWLLKAEPDGLDAQADWAARLSGGERQRLAFARLLLQLSRAGGNNGDGCLVLLDEATSACDEDTERSLYELLRTRLERGSLISIGHRGSLRSLHTRSVELSAPW